MSLIDYTLEGKVNKVDVAVQRIKAFDPVVTGMFDTPYYVAYSGGKDSDAIRILCELAGVTFDLVHNHTTVDAPETVRYVRSIPGIRTNRPDRTMWELIVQKHLPPTRRVRYCCSKLKERGGEGRLVMTGVRWSESERRKGSRGAVEVLGHKGPKLMLNADNDESRRLLENCRMKGKRMLNPIVDWHDADVWELLEHYGCPSNPLYREGHTRVGCVGCPVSNRLKREAEFRRWPKYKAVFIHAFDRMLRQRREEGLATGWTSGEEVFDWWMDDRNLDRQVDGQELIVGWESA